MFSSGVTNKVFVDGCSILISLGIGKVKHGGRFLLSPVLKPVHLNFSVKHVTKPVLVFPGVASDTVLVEAVILGDTIVQVE